MSELDAYRKAHSDENESALRRGLGVLVLPDARETPRPDVRRGVFRLDANVEEMECEKDNAC
jgi:hypothetical protein